MEWINPKTDWQPTDYINTEDYNRIRNNILYLKEYSETFFLPFNFSEPMESERSYEELAYAEYWNNLEDRLEDFIRRTYQLSELGTKKTYSAYDDYIDYVELNRLESVILRYKNFFDTQTNIAQRLSFELGNYGGIQI